MSISKKILIIAGEESGDMYGANIIQKLSKNQNLLFTRWDQVKCK